MRTGKLRGIGRVGGLAGVLVGGGIASARAQARPFLYTLVPAQSQARGASVYADLAYGHTVFAGLGPEAFEQRVGVQLRLSARLTLAAQAGWAPNDPSTPSAASAQAEAVASLVPAGSPLVLAIGVGGEEDYRRTPVALGRAVAGYRWARTLAVANVRFEHAFPQSTDGVPDHRDALDVISTLGVMHELGPGVRAGFESVAEDLEGFFETDEAEGGAKLMIGPSLGLGPRDARWTLQITTGPVFHLTTSTVPAIGSGAPRDLTGTGYVVRTSLGFQW